MFSRQNFFSLAGIFLPRTNPGLSGNLSDSHKTDYLAAVEGLLKNARSFDNFKRNKKYQKILEHVSFSQGLNYLEILKHRDDGILDAALATVLTSDDVGNPIKYFYDGVDIPLSPTTLRYVKVASDLKGLFGPGVSRIVEVGCGYGGQTLVNDVLLGYKQAELFDLPVVNQLIDRYLSHFILGGSYRTATLNNINSLECDLVISNYAFSELPFVLQNAYIQKIFANSPKGYLTMNSGMGGVRSVGKMTLEDLRSKIPSISIFEEQPRTSEYNFIITWGFNSDFSSEYFKPKK
jgi:putative sugar O-methyltransferase